MEINSNNLINKDLLQVDKFSGLKQDNLKNKDDEKLKKSVMILNHFFF